MKTLTTALMARFNATENNVHTSLYTLVSGRMFKERARQKAVLPYVVYYVISDIPEWNFCSDFERVRIQFNLFSATNDSVQVEDMYSALKALYDWKPLVIANYDHVYMKRLSASLTRDPVDDAWMYRVDYEIFMELI